MSHIVENALSHNVDESFTKCLDPDPEANDFQSLITSSLSTDTSVVKFHEDLFSSFYAKLPTDKQTNKQTNEGHYITSLAEVTRS